ncbi:MAG: hypothetical protein K6C98_00230 [Treponema sp.]|nr:hypothetical protein [Treponema sp.]
MTKEQFVCESLDKGLAYCFNPEVSSEEMDKYLTKVEGKLVNYVINKKMSYNEFAHTDDILVRMKKKKKQRLEREKAKK